MRRPSLTEAARARLRPVKRSPLWNSLRLGLRSARRFVHALAVLIWSSEGRQPRRVRRAQPPTSRRVLATLRPAPVAVRIRADALRFRSEEIIMCRRLKGKAQVAPAGSADKRFLSALPVSHVVCYLLRMQPPRLPVSRPTLNITEVM